MSDNLDEVIRLLRAAAAREPHDPAVHQKLFEALIRAGRAEEAAAAFRGLVAACPEWAQYHFDALNRVGHTRLLELHEAFRAATARDPGEATAWYGLGLVLQLRRDQPAAAEAFRRGLQADPRAAVLHYNLGISLMGDRQRAAEHHRRAVSLSPTIAEPHFALGVIAMHHDPARAPGHFRDFLRLAPPYLAAYIQQARASLRILRAPEDAPD